MENKSMGSFVTPLSEDKGPNMDYEGNEPFDMDDDIEWIEDMESSGPMNNGFGASKNFRPRKKFNRKNFGSGPGFGGGPPRFFGPGPGPMGPGPYGPPPCGPPPPLMWGRGFGPGGPPVRKPKDHKALRYLMRCGVAKENLRNLPRDMLQLIEPEYCGLCAHSFDSFQLSRLHYISKNHLKSQKKWLAHQSEVGFQRPREIPLKSRDLYCELCDVHITSKTHAESHYSGKPHRAIVERRKTPKNPMLLPRAMHDRVEQLIRREKKHLKVSNEEVEEVQETPKEAKPFQPELYCDICKTSVTCTEQMTMHLNGKRHLAKEKQHILKMMKGEGAADVSENAAAKSSTETEPEVKEEEEPVDASEAQAEGTQDDDWANGSGNWDEPTNAAAATATAAAAAEADDDDDDDDL